MKSLVQIVSGVLSLVVLMSPFAELNARELAGVSIAKQAAVAGVEKPLQLNGAGIRTKFFFKIYIGALYLPQVQKSAQKILATTQPNRLLMHFVYDEVSQQKLVDAWQDGFKNNTDKTEYEAVQERLSRFNQMFIDMKKDDVILLDYIPGQGTRVTIKGVEKGLIEGADFNRALLSVWLGDEPVTEELKDAMLGLDTASE